jgi:hypothetical protein
MNVLFLQEKIITERFQAIFPFVHIRIIYVRVSRGQRFKICGFLILYIKMNVCLFVCMELIQIHISEPIWTRLCTRLPLGLEETVVYVWTRNSWHLRGLGSFFGGGHCGIMGTKWLPVRPFSAVRDSSWCSCDVTDMTSQTAESSAAALHPWF